MVKNKRELTERQQKVFSFLTSYWNENGYSPTVREIQSAIDADSTQTIFTALNELEEAGYIKREKEKPRAITIIKSSDSGNATTLVPIVKRIRTSQLLLDNSNISSFYSLPDKQVQKSTFLYRMEGNALVEKNIFDKDMLIFEITDHAEDGDIVAVLADDAPVVRILAENKTTLQSANRAFSEIEPNSMEIVGKLISLIRYF